MARKPGERYPSDDGRLKVRPHVKIHLSWANHEQYARAFENLEIRAIVVGLWVVARRAFAGKTSNRVTLTGADLRLISGRSQFQSGVNSLRTACEFMAYPLEVHDRFVVVTVRNFAKKQGFTPANSGATPAAPAPSDSDSDTDTNTEKNTRVNSQEGSGSGTESEGSEARAAPVREPGSPEAEGAMDALIAVIDEVVPGSSIPEPGTARYRAWILELDRLHTLGEPGSKGPGWDWSTIHRVIAWLPRSERGGDFSWGRVVRSGSKLRKHFARILADLEAEARPAPKRMSEIDRNLAEINEKYRRSLDADDSGQRDEAGESISSGGEEGQDGGDDRDTDPMA